MNFIFLYILQFFCHYLLITPEFDGVVPEGTPLNWQADIMKLQSLGFSPSVPLGRGIKTFAYWCRAELVGV
jgi:UDP-glucose 4-epimerase